MPVRNEYGIRTSLGRSFMNAQIQLGGGGINVRATRKPFTIGTFLYAMGAMVAFAMLFSNSVIKNGGIWGKVLFTAGYVATYLALMTRTRTLNYKLSYLPVLFRYWRRGGRRVEAGMLDAGGPLKNLLGIEPKHGIDPNGTIHFTDGEVGVIFDVVGNASTMIFDEDQKQVIADARTVYKNLPSTCGMTLITQASSQDVHLQIQSKLDQLHKLAIDSPGLRQVIKKQGQVLRDTVGKNFSMIRQYLLIRGSEENVETMAKMIFQAANSSTNNFLKQALPLTNEPVAVGSDGMPLNEPYQVEKLLSTIFNDYGHKRKPK